MDAQKKQDLRDDLLETSKTLEGYKTAQQIVSEFDGELSFDKVIQEIATRVVDICDDGERIKKEFFNEERGIPDLIKNTLKIPLEMKEKSKSAQKRSFEGYVLNKKTVLEKFSGLYISRFTKES